MTANLPGTAAVMASRMAQRHRRAPRKRAPAPEIRMCSPVPEIRCAHLPRKMRAVPCCGYLWVVQPASEPPERPAGRFHRARALYRNVSKRRTAWLLLKDTVNSCMEYRILGLAAEAAFFTLLSVPPLLLSMIGLLGYVDDWTGADTIHSLETNLLEASRTVFSDRGVKEIAEPILHDVMQGGRPDVISIGFALALW